MSTVGGARAIERDGSADGPRSAMVSWTELVPRELIASLLRDLRQLAALRLAGERSGHTLQPTALVHELWLRIAGRADLRFESREAFLAYAAEALRHILIDHARRRSALRRGGKRNESTGALDVELLALLPDRSDDQWATAMLELDEELELLRVRHPRAARVFDLRYYGGLSNVRIAAMLGVTDRTVRTDWAAACGWLCERLDVRSRS